MFKNILVLNKRNMEKIEIVDDPEVEVLFPLKEINGPFPSLVKKALALAIEVRDLKIDNKVISSIKFYFPDDQRKEMSEFLEEILHKKCWFITQEEQDGTLEISFDLVEVKIARFLRFFDKQINDALCKLFPTSHTDVKKNTISRIQEDISGDSSSVRKVKAPKNIWNTIVLEEEVLSEENAILLREDEIKKAEDIIVLHEEFEEQPEEDFIEAEVVKVDVLKNFRVEKAINTKGMDRTATIAQKSIEKTINSENMENISSPKDASKTALIDFSASDLKNFPDARNLQIKINLKNSYQVEAWEYLVKEQALKNGEHFTLRIDQDSEDFYEINLLALREHRHRQLNISSVCEFFAGDYKIDRLDDGGMATVLKLVTKNDLTIVVLRPENRWARNIYTPYLQVRQGVNGEECILAHMPKDQQFVVKVAFEGSEEALVYESRLLANLAEDPKINEHVVGFVQQGSFLASQENTNEEEAKIGYYLMLEYASNGNLYNFAQHFPRKQIPLSVAFHIIYYMAITLRLLKEKGLIHRDLKPQNILLNQDIMPKLSDFGLAITTNEASSHLNEERRRLLRLVDREFLQISKEKKQCENKLKKLQKEINNLEHLSNMEKFKKLVAQIAKLQREIDKLTEKEENRAKGLQTKYRMRSTKEIASKGEFAGSLTYAAPEQFKTTKLLTCQCDVYQLAAMAYMIISGKRPVDGRDMDEIVEKILFDEQPKITDVVKLDNVALNKLSKLIFQMMEKDPQKRINIEEVCDQLEEILLINFQDIKSKPCYMPSDIKSTINLTEWQKQLTYIQDVHNVCVQHLDRLYKKVKNEHKKRIFGPEILHLYVQWNTAKHLCILCPKCRQKVIITKESIGREMSCKHCQSQLSVQTIEEVNFLETETRK